ncbi:uncharacterized protein LOC119655111 [Hermetia illucens]|uniref:uncharacterized protein LOC119655111 n=1 Tax=Hermetia illucens TaxID=343691 RepID=UPI0018CC3C49|nr:uncharacterized protein LOC119655111 [Hermetia illucens]
MDLIVMFCAFLIVVAAKPFQPASQQQFKQIFNECLKSSNASPELAKLLSTNVYPETSEVDHILRCQVSRLGIFVDSSTGGSSQMGRWPSGYDPDRVMAQFKAAGYSLEPESVSSCLSQYEKLNENEKASKEIRCLVRKAREQRSVLRE